MMRMVGMNVLNLYLPNYLYQPSASKSIMIPMLIFIIMMANVSVLSKLGKFFHPINPTRQYQACVLSTHRSKMLLSSATPHNHINIKLLAYWKDGFKSYQYKTASLLKREQTQMVGVPLYQRCQAVSLYLYCQTSSHT